MALRYCCLLFQLCQNLIPKLHISETIFFLIITLQNLPGTHGYSPRVCKGSISKSWTVLGPDSGLGPSSKTGLALVRPK